MWILILTILSSSQGSVSVTSVPGFTSTQTCQKAGRDVVRDLTSVRRVYFQCVKK